MPGKYDDIISLSHPVSKKHPQMSLMDRAAQFAPFAALTGYNEAVKETARLTDKRIELDECEKEILREKLNLIMGFIHSIPQITVSYFEPDHQKNGGSYQTVTGHVKKIDDYEGTIYFTDGMKIAISEIAQMDSELLHTYF